MVKKRKIRSNKGKKRGPYKSRKKQRQRTKSVNKDIYTLKPKSECVIMDINNQKIVLPNNYPGDEWVHQYLVPNRDIDLKYYQTMRPDILSNTYQQYKNLCQK